MNMKKSQSVSAINRTMKGNNMKFMTFGDKVDVNQFAKTQSTTFKQPNLLKSSKSNIDIEVSGLIKLDYDNINQGSNILNIKQEKPQSRFEKAREEQKKANNHKAFDPELAKELYHLKTNQLKMEKQFQSIVTKNEDRGMSNNNNKRKLMKIKPPQGKEQKTTENRNDQQ